MKKIFCFSLLACVALMISACSKNHAQPQASDLTRAAQAEHGWLSDGSLMVSRPAPAISVITPEKLMGFLPAMGMHTGTWLSINTGSQTLNLMEGDQVLLSSTAQGVEKAKAGAYKVIHKQTRPVWYAPDSYFLSRKLAVPPKSDVSRFRKGALGDFVLIFNRETPIHNGPVWSDDVGGIRLNDSDIARIYYKLDIDSVVEVK